MSSYLLAQCLVNEPVLLELCERGFLDVEEQIGLAPSHVRGSDLAHALVVEFLPLVRRAVVTVRDVVAPAVAAAVVDDRNQFVVGRKRKFVREFVLFLVAFELDAEG